MGVCASSDAQIGDTPNTPSSTSELSFSPEASSSCSNNISYNSGFKVFAGTFNINGSPLPPVDVESWLVSHGASSCDLIFLAFQECATCSWASGASPSVRLGDKAQEALNERNDADFLGTILKSLEERYEIIGDTAIGEPPTSHKVDIEGIKTEWYGFIRLVGLKARNSQVDVGRVVPFEVRGLNLPGLVRPFGMVV